jgi:hypothetical protein
MNAADYSGLVTWEEYLRDSAVPRCTIDDFLRRPTWAKFDPELGYVLNNSLIPWGVDGSRAIETVKSSGARSGFMYPGRKVRINTYGDSFTECNQVNDGETWQEYLAAHFGEPIGNFGVGGYGAYQAYRRLLRNERTQDGAENVVLYVWGDDTVRSMMRSRWASLYHVVLRNQARGPMFFGFFGNPWPHFEIDLCTGQFVEKDNPLSTSESLYKMCDPEWMLEYLSEDLAVHLCAYSGMPEYGHPGRLLALNRPLIERLADALHVPWDWSPSADLKQQALALLNIYGQRATIEILDRVLAFTRSRNKRLLIVLNCTARPDWLRPLPYGGVRQDQEILDHLVDVGFDYFDMNEAHQTESEKTRATYTEYMSQYLVGAHYNPRGNHLFAYSIKNKLLEMLIPRPLPYREEVIDRVDFSAYLPNA